MGKLVAAAALALAMALALATANAKQQHHTQLIAANCDSTRRIPAGNPYNKDLQAVLQDLRRNTAAAGKSLRYKSKRASAGRLVYGEGVCSTSYSVQDCNSCLQYLSTHITTICKNSATANVQLAGCYIRYSDKFF